MPTQHDSLAAALHHHFQFDAFRPGQAEVLSALLGRESVLAVMPTGAGKSLCYQLAAMLLPGTALVLSPLIALMKDQVDNLPPSVARHATSLTSALGSSELDRRLTRAARGHYRLLYAAPERLRQRPFLHALAAAGVSLLVVDEAHCVSLWGHDFRPDYLFIARAWHELGRPPILAMTATATPRVREDIRASLGAMRLIATDVIRPNLHLEAHRFSSDECKSQALLAMCRETDGSGIVYAKSRDKCERIAIMLQQQGVSAIHYHAGIEDRVAAQDRFMSGAARIVVATVAFGMGIDKADVRFVIHYNPPQSLENYYQEAGRAGRDGLPARCVLFHAPADAATMARWAHKDATSIEILRQVYHAIQHRLGDDGLCLCAIADLERDVGADETRLRVAVQFLEAAGLLWRGCDLPRSAELVLRTAGHEPDGDFSRFVEAARLRMHQPVSRDLLSTSRDAGLDPRSIELQVLDWQAAGWLEYRGIGRDMLVASPPPPIDAHRRLEALLVAYASGQAERIADMTAYAKTVGCRHGHISAHFGGPLIDRCHSCDNCGLPRNLPAAPKSMPSAVCAPAPIEHRTRVILEGVASLPQALTRTDMARALKGMTTSPVQADCFPLFGALSDLTRSAIGQLAAQLVDRGLLAYAARDGGRRLRITAQGRNWLADRSPTQPLAHPDPRPTARQVQPMAGDLARDGEILFQALRTWRVQRAREQNVPSYVVFHDSVLKRIAATQPKDLGELAAVKGVGPHKLAAYGDAVLAIVAAHRAPATSQRE